MLYQNGLPKTKFYVTFVSHTLGHWMALDLVDPTTQFKVSRAMGNAVATLLAEMSAAEFAAAFRVMDVAMNIVREHQEEKQAETGAAPSEGGDGAVTTYVDSCDSGASVDVSWTRGI